MRQEGLWEFRFQPKLGVWWGCGWGKGLKVFGRAVGKQGNREGSLSLLIGGSLPEAAP